MKIQELLAKIQTMPIDVQNKVEIDAKFYIPLWEREWEIKRNPEDPKTLSLEDAGKAIRIIIATMGKSPDSDWITTKGSKKVVWNIGTSPRKRMLANRVAAELYFAGITDFTLSSKQYGMFIIHIPEESYVSVFQRSDDPAIWKAENERKIKIRKVNQVVRKMDKR